MADYQTCGRSKRDGSGDPCQRPAGWGTDHPGEGACKLHGGNAGAPKGNDNATKHALNADPYNYYNSLEAREEAFVKRLASAVESRIRDRSGEVDSLDEKLAQRIAIEIHIVSRASDYLIHESGLAQLTDEREDSREYRAALLGEVRKRDKAIIHMLRDLGILDTNGSIKAESIEKWRSWVEEGNPGFPESY